MFDSDIIGNLSHKFYCMVILFIVLSEHLNNTTDNSVPIFRPTSLDNDETFSDSSYTSDFSDEILNDTNSFSADESVVAPPYSPIVYNDDDAMGDDSGRLYEVMHT